MSLGAFNTCDGLGCEVVIEQREEGGNNGYVWQLPDPDEVLQRQALPAGHRGQREGSHWFAGMATGIQRKTATIEARTADGTVIAQWGLLDVASRPVDRSVS